MFAQGERDVSPVAYSGTQQKSVLRFLFVIFGLDLLLLLHDRLFGRIWLEGPRRAVRHPL
jgi:hypothetical protein